MSGVAWPHDPASGWLGSVSSASSPNQGHGLNHNCNKSATLGVDLGTSDDARETFAVCSEIQLSSLCHLDQRPLFSPLLIFEFFSRHRSIEAPVQDFWQDKMLKLLRSFQNRTKQGLVVSKSGRGHLGRSENNRVGVCFGMVSPDSMVTRRVVTHQDARFTLSHQSFQCFT